MSVELVHSLRDSNESPFNNSVTFDFGSQDIGGCRNVTRHFSGTVARMLLILELNEQGRDNEVTTNRDRGRTG